MSTNKQAMILKKFSAYEKLVIAILALTGDRKKLLIFFYSGFILGTFFCSITTSYPMLIAARITTGLFGGVIGSVSMAIVADLFTIDRRGRVMGLMQNGVWRKPGIRHPNRSVHCK